MQGAFCDHYLRRLCSCFHNYKYRANTADLQLHPRESPIKFSYNFSASTEKKEEKQKKNRARSLAPTKPLCNKLLCISSVLGAGFISEKETIVCLDASPKKESAVALSLISDKKFGGATLDLLVLGFTWVRGFWLFCCCMYPLQSSMFDTRTLDFCAENVFALSCRHIGEKSWKKSGARAQLERAPEDFRRRVAQIGFWRVR